MRPHLRACTRGLRGLLDSRRVACRQNSSLHSGPIIAVAEVVVKLAKLVKPDCLFASFAAVRSIVRASYHPHKRDGLEVKSALDCGSFFVGDTMYGVLWQAPAGKAWDSTSKPPANHPPGRRTQCEDCNRTWDRRRHTVNWKAATLPTALGAWIKPVVAFAASESTLSSERTSLYSSRHDVSCILSLTGSLDWTSHDQKTKRDSLRKPDRYASSSCCSSV